MSVDEFVIWSFEHGAYWRPAEIGYTRELAEAGRYSKADADRIIASANLVSLNEIAILARHAEAADGAAKRPALVYSARTAPIACPICARILDAATGVALEPGAVAEPAAGDITCCAYCGAVLVFEASGFRLAATEDLAAIDPDLRRLVLEFSASRSRNTPH